MISCETAKELIGNALDGTLEASERAALEAHAGMCPSCRAEMERLDLIGEILGDVFSVEMDLSQAKSQIMAQLSNPTEAVIERRSDLAVRWSWARTAAAAVVALVAGLALGFVLGRSEPDRAAASMEVPMRVGHLEGMVLVRHEGSDSWQPVETGAAVLLGDTFHSMPKAEFVLELPNNSRIEVNPSSMLVLAEYGDKTEFTLEQGECTASLQSPHGPFFIRTPNGRLEALGTEFTVTVE